MAAAQGARFSCFTCFTNTNVQIEEERRVEEEEAARKKAEEEHLTAVQGTQFICVSSTKVHILTRGCERGGGDGGCGEQ